MINITKKDIKQLVYEGFKRNKVYHNELEELCGAGNQYFMTNPLLLMDPLMLISWNMHEKCLIKLECNGTREPGVGK